LGVFQLQFQLSTAAVGLAPSSYLIALHIQINSGKHTRFCFTVKNPVASNVGIYIFNYSYFDSCGHGLARYGSLSSLLTLLKRNFAIANSSRALCKIPVKTL
jgi:hypothetical protein